MTDIDHLVDTIKRYRGSWNLGEKVGALGRDQPEDFLPSLLWEAFREGRADLGEDQAFWHDLHKAPNAYNADDVLALITAINKHFPNGTKKTDYGSTSCFSDSDLPGWLWSIKAIIEPKKDDSTFVEKIKTGWIGLPKPYDTGLAYQLAQADILAHGELPDELLKQAAIAHLGHGCGNYEGWRRPGVWPDDVWGPALVSAALDPSIKCFEKSGVLAEMVAHASVEKMIEIAKKAGYGPEAFGGVDALDEFGKGAVDALEAAIKKLKIPSKYQWEEPCPEFTLIGTYLRACTATGRTPSEDLDPQFQAFLTHFDPSFSGSSFDEFHDKMTAALSAIPQERLETLLLNTKEVQWLLAPAAPTPKVIQRVVDGIAALPKNPPYEFNDRSGCLNKLMPLGIDIVTSALGGKPCPQRRLFVAALANSKDDRAVKGLAIALRDSSKSVREAARSGLARLSAEAVLSELPDLVAAKKKDTRIEAAQVLVALEPTERGYELAKERLQKEKVEDIKKLLLAVKAPDGTGDVEGGAGQASEILKDLEGSEGKAWKKHEEHGAALVEIFWSFLEKTYYEESISTYGDVFTSWKALLLNFKNEETVRWRAAMTLPCFRYGGGDWLEFLFENFQDMGPTLARVITEGKYGRTPKMGKYHEYELDECLRWLDSNQPRHAVGPLVYGLTDRRKKVRSTCIEALAERGSDVTEKVTAVLESGAKKDALIAVATLLGRLGDADALPHLEEALKKQKTKAIKDALEGAIVAVQAASLNVSKFDDDAKGNKKLDAALSKLRPHPLPGELKKKKLPSLSWKKGDPLSTEAHAWFVAQLAQENLETRSDTLRAVRSRLDDEACHKLSLAIIAAAGRDDRDWPLYVQSVIGTPEQIDAIAKKLEVLASSQRTKWGDDGVEALARYATDAAIRHLDDWSRRSKRAALRSRAAGGLARMARVRGVSVDDLVDSAISTFGFDSKGKQTVSYGPRSILVELGPNNEVVIIDDKGKRLKSMPKARKDDDAALVDTSRAHVSEMKKQIKRIHALQVKRLELAMASERTWSTEDWRTRFLDHPLMNAFSQRIIFEALDAKGTPLLAFITTVEHELMNVESDTVTLPEETELIRILHPIYLDDATKKRWVDVFADFEISPPFEQLERRVFLKASVPKDDEQLFQKLPMSTSSYFARTLSKIGYERGPREDAGLIHVSYRTIGDLSVTLSHTSFAPEILDDKAEMEVNGLVVSDGEKTIDWRTLSPSIFSEIVRDLHLLTKA